MVGQLLASNPLIGQVFLQQLLSGEGGVRPSPVAGAGNIHGLPMVGGLGQVYSLGQVLNPSAVGQMGLSPYAIQGGNTPGVCNDAFLYQHHGAHQGQQVGMSSLPLGGIHTMSVQGSSALAPTPPARGTRARPVEPPPSLSILRQTLTADAIGPDVPPALPVVLFLLEDESKLSAYQILLRSQIEFFSATSDDIATHARGRNKPITLGQVGIRCKHCKHLAANRRSKGSVYFPFSLVGLYQAAQNMGSSHFNGQSCSEMDAALKQQFVEVLACKSTVGSGKQYWAKAAKKLGMMDTEEGLRFVRDLIVIPT
jgi:hypothetical protein